MLKLENVSLFYEEGTKALSDITLRIKDGECILLTGESGSGKSSMINVINGLAYKYENAHITGSIQIDGKEIKELELYEIAMIIASVFQNPKTHFFHVNTTQELLFYLENMGVDRLTMKARMEDMLGIFSIEHLLERSIFELSGGEKQVLCVASSYISGCRIIVLDEPTSNLDEQSIDILKEMLCILKSKGITLIIAEHRMHYLMDVVDRIALLRQGQIERVFTRDEFLSVNNALLKEWGIRCLHGASLMDKTKQCGKDLIIRKLCCKFKYNSALKMEDISFGLGRIYGLTGKNGCGKSTFLRIMTGLENKDKSEIFWQGKLLNKKKRLQYSALVMQDVNHQLFSDTVQGEMILGVKDVQEDRIYTILSELGLMELKDKHPMSLSGGQKQRVAIASVLNQDARFIFFDEPTSGMDYKNMRKISDLIKNMSTKENIIWIVSHDIEFLNETSDEVLCLEDFLV